MCPKERWNEKKETKLGCPFSPLGQTGPFLMRLAMQ